MRTSWKEIVCAAVLAMNCYALYFGTRPATTYVHDYVGVQYYVGPKYHNAVLVNSNICVGFRTCLMNGPLPFNGYITPEMTSQMVERVLIINMNNFRSDGHLGLRPVVKSDVNLEVLYGHDVVHIPFLNDPFPRSDQTLYRMFQSTNSDFAINLHEYGFDLMTKHHAGTHPVVSYNYNAERDVREYRWWRPCVYVMYLTTIPWDIVTLPAEIYLFNQWLRTHFWK